MKLRNRQFEDVMNEVLNTFVDAGVDFEILKKAKEYALHLKTKQLNKNRVIMVGCCVYLASLSCKMPISQRHIGHITGVTETSIKNNYKFYSLILEDCQNAQK